LNLIRMGARRDLRGRLGCSAKQLVAIKYKLTSKGQIAVESKDEMRKRGVASPGPRRRAGARIRRCGGAEVDIATHARESITEDLMTKAW
jgi:hypothetical protein